MGQVKISKELFIDTINQIQKGLKKNEKASDALENIIDGSPVITIGTDFLNALIILLENVCDDKSDTIGWWLYEDVEKKIWIQPQHKDNHTGKEIEIDVSTPGKLYDYFVKW